MRYRVILCSVALLATGCGGGSSSSGPSTTLSGTYSGTETFTIPLARTFSFQVVVIQNGNNISGSYSNGSGDRGTFSGTLSGNDFSGTASSAIAPITCNVVGSVTDGGAAFHGTVACSNGSGGTFTLTRA